MSVPKSVTKVSRNGDITFTSSVDRCQYTIKELTRGALRDVGKYIAKQYRIKFYQSKRRQFGKVAKGTSYWVRSRKCDLQVGLGRKGVGFWAGFYEVGTSKTRRENLLRTTVLDNIDMIIKIQGQYLSEIEKDVPKLAGLKEGEYEGE